MKWFPWSSRGYHEEPEAPKPFYAVPTAALKDDIEAVRKLAAKEGMVPGWADSMARVLRHVMEQRVPDLPKASYDAEHDFSTLHMSDTLVVGLSEVPRQVKEIADMLLQRERVELAAKTGRIETLGRQLDLAQKECQLLREQLAAAAATIARASRPKKRRK